MKSGCLISESGLFPLFYAASCECLPGINFLPLKTFSTFLKSESEDLGAYTTQATSAKSRQSQRDAEHTNGCSKARPSIWITAQLMVSKESRINLATGSDEQCELCCRPSCTCLEMGKPATWKIVGYTTHAAPQQHTESSVLVCSTVALWKGLDLERNMAEQTELSKGQPLLTSPEPYCTLSFTFPSPTAAVVLTIKNDALGCPVFIISYMAS